MRIIAAYLLAVLGGNNSPKAADITKILGSVGIEADAARVDKLIAELTGKNIEDVIKAGSAKLASVPAAPAGGAAGGAAAAAAGGAAPAAGGAAPKAAAKEEAPAEEEAAMAFDLFD